MLFQSKGIGGDAGATARGTASQHAIAGGIIGIPFLVGAPRIPGHQVIEHIIGECCRRSGIGATGEVAPGIIARRVGGSRWTATRGSCSSFDTCGRAIVNGERGEEPQRLCSFY